MTIKTKRVYDKPDPTDGYRVLVMTKPIWTNAAFNRENFDSWVSVLSPSRELLKSYETGMINWDLFTEGFLKEMKDPISWHHTTVKCLEQLPGYYPIMSRI